MLQTFEVEIDSSGHIHPLEPIMVLPTGRALLTLLPVGLSQPVGRPHRPARGAMKGMLSSVDEFIAAKEAEIALEERR